MAKVSALYQEFLKTAPDLDYKKLVAQGADSATLVSAREKYFDFLKVRLDKASSEEFLHVVDEIIHELKDNSVSQSIQKEIQSIVERARSSRLPEEAAAAVPRGISAGKLTAYIAGAALVAGAAAYLWPKKHDESATQKMWSQKMQPSVHGEAHNWQQYIQTREIGVSDKTL